MKVGDKAVLCFGSFLSSYSDSLASFSSEFVLQRLDAVKSISQIDS